MTPDQERRLFADGLIRTCNEWVVSSEWMAHESLDLPEAWIETAYEEPNLAGAVARYVAAAEESGPVSFGDAIRIRDHGFDWYYRPVLGAEPTEINADVAQFFETLTPGAEWGLAWSRLISKGSKVAGPILARVRGEQVLFVVAGRNPAIQEAAA